MNASMKMLGSSALQLWHQSPAQRLCRWWLGELAGMVPSSVKQWFSTGVEWHLIERVDDQWQWRSPHAAIPVARWSDAMADEEQQAIVAGVLAGLSPEVARVALLVPDAWALRRRMTFPAAARDRLMQAASYEIDRQTPFRAADVVHGLGAASPLANGTQLSAEWVVVPRSLLDPLLATFRTLGVVLDAVDVGEGVGRKGLNLLAAGDVPRRVHRRARLNRILLAGAELLLLLSMLQWVHNREATLRDMQGEVARMQAEVGTAAALRQRLQDYAGATGFLAERKKNRADVLSILQELSLRLPQSAWLERLSVDHTGQVGMQGQGAQAASLLEALKGATWLAEPAFQGAIQKDPSTGKERFYMVAQLRKPADAKPKPAPAAAGSAP